MKNLKDKVFKQNCGDSLVVLEKTQQKNSSGALFLCNFTTYPYKILANKRAILQGWVVNPEIERVTFIDKIWTQKCNRSLKIIEKTDKKEGTNYLWKCQFIGDDDFVFNTKQKIVNGQVLPNEDIVGEVFLQKCEDKIQILEKTKQRDKWGNILYRGVFLKYPHIIYRAKKDILGGIINNPQIEIEEFKNKIWTQNCGDNIKVLKKTKKKDKFNNYFWKCQFIKNPYKILATKNQIVRGQVKNPLLEDFIGRAFEQKCNDFLVVLKKSNKKDNIGNYLYECDFLNYPYKVLARKNLILSGAVDNKNYPDKSKDKLESFIKEHFIQKPTLLELSSALNRGYSTIMHKINKFGLRKYIKYCPISKQEKELKEFCEKLAKRELSSNWEILNGKEIDVFLSEERIGIEFNGNIWHSNDSKLGIDNNYHQNKSLLAKEKNIQLIHIFEYEWEDKKEQLKDFIKSKLGIFEKKIFARKCKVKEIDSKIYFNFCSENHIQGSCRASIKIGLYYDEELIQIISFSKPRFTKKYEWEIIRECSKRNYCIIGGKAKLFKYFLRKCKPKTILSYCDFSKFKGDSYKKLGFEKIRLNKPGFIWYDVKSNITYPRSPSRHKEMKNKGFLKIYDAGQLVFVWNKNQL